MTTDGMPFRTSLKPAFFKANTEKPFSPVIESVLSNVENLPEHAVSEYFIKADYFHSSNARHSTDSMTSPTSRSIGFDSRIISLTGSSAGAESTQVKSHQTNSQFTSFANPSSSVLLSVLSWALTSINEVTPRFASFLISRAIDPEWDELKKAGDSLLTSSSDKDANPELNEAFEQLSARTDEFRFKVAQLIFSQTEEHPPHSFEPLGIKNMSPQLRFKLAKTMFSTSPYTFVSDLKEFDIVTLTAYMRFELASKVCELSTYYIEREWSQFDVASMSPDQRFVLAKALAKHRPDALVYPKRLGFRPRILRTYIHELRDSA